MTLLVGQAFSNRSRVPWKIFNRWENCLHLVKSVDFSFSHTYREDNSCADKIVTLGLSFHDFLWRDTIPPSISLEFSRNKIALPNYRIR